MKYYDPCDIASILKINPKKIYHFISNNQLPCIQMGANYKISEIELSEFMKKYYKYLDTKTI